MRLPRASLGSFLPLARMDRGDRSRPAVDLWAGPPRRKCLEPAHTTAHHSAPQHTSRHRLTPQRPTASSPAQHQHQHQHQPTANQISLPTHPGELVLRRHLIRDKMLPVVRRLFAPPPSMNAIFQGRADATAKIYGGPCCFPFTPSCLPDRPPPMDMIDTNNGTALPDL